MFDKKLIRNFDYLIPLIIILITGLGLIGIGRPPPPVEGADGAVMEAIEASTSARQLQLMCLLPADFNGCCHQQIISLRPSVYFIG